MPATLPSSRTWMLRFKNHRSTILLHADPLQKLSTIRAELLKAISETHPDGSLNGHLLPTNSDDILLARAVDRNDLDLGWESLETPDEAADNAGGGNKGKGKAGLTNTQQTNKGSVLSSPQGAGLRNGDIVAFKFRTSTDDNANSAQGAAEEDKAILAGLEEQWDVKIPTVEETYGDQQAEDNVVAEPT